MVYVGKVEDKAGGKRLGTPSDSVMQNNLYLVQRVMDNHWRFYKKKIGLGGLVFSRGFLAAYVGLSELRMEQRGAEEGVEAATAVGGP